MADKIDYSDKYNPGFVAWINSINSGFQHMIPYRPFLDYCKDAKDMLADPTDIEDLFTDHQKIEYISDQFAKFRDNTTYFLDKLGTYKDADKSDGFIHMRATMAQKVLLFLADRGYSVILGKARHVTATTAMGIFAVKKISYVPEYYIKFITHTKPKGVEILRDKVKYPYANIPEWAKVSADTSYRDDRIITGARGGTKSEKKGTGAMIEVAAPTDDAINGGSPSCVLIDEIGFIDNITTIMREGRPTMFRKNYKTGKLEMIRQFFGWGTASMEGTKISYFKEEYLFCSRQWEAGNYEYGIIPLFFNCFAREGFTQEDYDREKRIAESREGMDREKAIVQFFQHYPLTIEDMFVSGSKTIIPFNMINDKIGEIRAAQGNAKDSTYPQYGYFDVANGTLEDYLNYKHTAPPVPVWVPVKGGIADQRTTAVIYTPPDPDWVWRYYKGTDPINTKSGHSKFASSILDVEKWEYSSVINFRRRNFKECYLQGILQTLYYSNRHHNVRELCEGNIGDMYFDMLDMFGLKSKHLILNSNLPPKLQGGGNDYGIKKTGSNSDKIMNNLLDLLQNYMDKLNDETLFQQLKTFVEREKKDTGFISFKPESRYDFDDVIDADVYAYIASQCFRYPPRKVGSVKGRTQVKYVMDTTSWTMRRARISADGRREYI